MQREGEDVPTFLARQRQNKDKFTPRCNCSESDLYKQETWTGGRCAEWDSFDFETAFKIMQEDEEKKACGAS